MVAMLYFDSVASLESELVQFFEICVDDVECALEAIDVNEVSESLLDFPDLLSHVLFHSIEGVVVDPWRHQIHHILANAELKGVCMCIGGFKGLNQGLLAVDSEREDFRNWVEMHVN